MNENTLLTAMILGQSFLIVVVLIAIGYFSWQFHRKNKQIEDQKSKSATEKSTLGKNKKTSPLTTTSRSNKRWYVRHSPKQ